ncbi:MAG: hypothetical protein SGCHY_001405 [Lobulomycetales sp.]
MIEFERNGMNFFVDIASSLCSRSISSLESCLSALSHTHQSYLTHTHQSYSNCNSNVPRNKSCSSRLVATHHRRKPIHSHAHDSLDSLPPSIRDFVSRFYPLDGKRFPLPTAVPEVEERISLLSEAAQAVLTVNPSSPLFSVKQDIVLDIVHLRTRLDSSPEDEEQDNDAVGNVSTGKTLFPEHPADRQVTAETKVTSWLTHLALHG